MKFSIIFAIFLCLAIFDLSTQQNVLDPFIQGRIVTGSPAALGQFPWQVILKKEEIDDLLCGGSIISTTWVLTAGHCTYGLSSIYLVFGTVDLEDDTALSMTSTQLFTHPNYNDNNLNNDVGLILLPTPLTFSSTIQPITLISSAESNSNWIGTTATIAGFGLTDDEYLEYSQTLLYAQVTIINNSQCVTIFGNDVVLSSTLCAQGANGSNMSICSGDSGGPLIIRSSNGNYIQIGINSFVAQDTCTQGYPSGYAKVGSFLNYISSTTGISFD